MFKLALEKLVRKDANIQKTLLREIKKLHHKGQGKAGAAFQEIPPTDFFPDISDVNERKMMFFKQCKEELKLSQVLNLGRQRVQVIQFTQYCVTN